MIAGTNTTSRPNILDAALDAALDAVTDGYRSTVERGSHTKALTGSVNLDLNRTPVLIP